MVGANPKTTPAETEALPADKQGNPTGASFNYASIVGMLQYLQGQTRPYITFAVSQCSRYIHRHTNMHTTTLRVLEDTYCNIPKKASFCNPHLTPLSTLM